METKAKVLKIMSLALEVTESGLADVFVEYSGHVKGLVVRVFPCDRDYNFSTKIQTCLYQDLTLYLESTDHSIRLDRVINFFEGLLTSSTKKELA